AYTWLLMPSPEEEIQLRLARIEAKQDELLSEIKWLLHTQSGLDSRLARVEDSMVFRSLRAIGRFYQTKIARKKAGASRGYPDWRSRAGMDAPPSAVLRTQPLISVLLSVRQPSRERLERSVRSVQAQTYPQWELIPVLDPAAPAWAQEHFGDARTASGEWVAHLGENDFLSPVALQHFAAAVQNSTPDLVYSDEDVVDAAGSPLRPVFKPDWSPVLLRHAPYTGGLRMERAGFRGQPSAAIHIPRILYHASEADYALPSPRTPARPLSSHPLVSIVVCTRNSSLLTRCL
ncbi:MAG: glycosyl transferase, family 2, partial [Bryobacterales bacterium]|nr:glycosyl transferase, family 2 [Bryobacterales bacterium]